MYKIVGADQKEYGPITEEQMREWIREGRVNGQTIAQVEGGPWKPLSTFPEFASELPAEGAGGSTPPAGGSLPSTGTPSGGREQAMQKVTGPAIGLMVTAGLGMANSLLGLVMNIFGMSFLPRNLPDPEMERFISLFSGAAGVVGAVIALAMGSLIIYGALRMRKLEGFGLSIAASIIALVPCVSPCCLLGIPIGIWALVVLNQPEVKSHFR